MATTKPDPCSWPSLIAQLEAQRPDSGRVLRPTRRLPAHIPLSPLQAPPPFRPASRPRGDRLRRPRHSFSRSSAARTSTRSRPAIDLPHRGHPRRRTPSRRRPGLRSRDPPPRRRCLGATPMLTLHPSVRIFVCTAPADMRRGFDGLAQMAQDIVRQDPLSGHFSSSSIVAATASRSSTGTVTAMRCGPSGWKPARSACPRPRVPRSKSGPPSSPCSWAGSIRPAHAAEPDSPSPDHPVST